MGIKKKAKILVMLAEIYKMHQQKTYSQLKTLKLKYCGTYYESFIKRLIDDNNDTLLKKKIRICSATFHYLVRLVRDAPQFAYWNNNNLKSSRFTSVEKQVCIFLYFVSRNYHYDDIADLFGLSGGNVVSTIVDRVASAIKHYKNQFIKWHNTASKIRMLEKAATFGFPNCIALADGVINTVTSFDKQYAASWTTRKKNYGICTLVLCDLDDKYFILFHW